MFFREILSWKMPPMPPRSLVIGWLDSDDWIPWAASVTPCNYRFPIILVERWNISRASWKLISSVEEETCPVHLPSARPCFQGWQDCSFGLVDRVLKIFVEIETTQGILGTILEPVCPLFWSLNPPKEGLFHSKQGSYKLGNTSWASWLACW